MQDYQHQLTQGHPDVFFGLPQQISPMTAVHPNLEPCPSPQPEIPESQCSISGDDAETQPTAGDVELIGYLDNGRVPALAYAAGAKGLPRSINSPIDEPRPAEHTAVSHDYRISDTLGATVRRIISTTEFNEPIPTGSLHVYDEPAEQPTANEPTSASNNNEAASSSTDSSTSDLVTA